MAMKLVSYKLCPYVQRALITAAEKKISIPVSYIDLENKPDWFLARSPRGKVPVLLVDDAETLFESHAIAEYIDELEPEQALMPDTPLLRAKDRAWFAFIGDAVFGPMHRLEYLPEKEAVLAAHQALMEALGRLEAALGSRDYLSGDGSRFGMADVGLAPFFYRAELAEQQGRAKLLAAFPGLQGLSARHLARPSVAAAVPEDFETFARAVQSRKGAWLLANPGALDA